MRDAHSGTDFPDTDYVVLNGKEIIGRVYQIANGTQEVMVTLARGLIACPLLLPVPVRQFTDKLVAVALPLSGFCPLRVAQAFARRHPAPSC
jgi:hypothetical protein